MKKKLLTILLVFMLIPACFIQAFSNDKFADVSEESWYKESVDYVAEYGLMNGITDDTFAPDKKMSRAMFVTVLGRMANTVGATATSFTDITADSYYAPYVSWAVENAIVSGTSETTFSPDNNLTREQMAVIITNFCTFAGFPADDDWAYQTDYTDTADISSWATGAVSICSTRKLMQGSDGAFMPLGDVTRAQAATIIKRLHEILYKEDLTDNELYNRAVFDSITIENDELLPLVTLTKEEQLVEWNKDGDKVLLCSWHKYPDSYVKGNDATLQWGEVWAFTEKEFAAWYERNKESGITDWELRMKQLIGLPPATANTHVTLMWVSPEDIYRPANKTDITSSEMVEGYPEVDDEEYIKWFADNIEWSYIESAYPWTRLGYTYDWAESSLEYGITEFIIKKGATVSVYDTLTTEEFLAHIANHTEHK